MRGVTKAADGVPIVYETAGVAGGPAVVLVHGWSCDRTYWRHQLADDLGDQLVVAVDLAGHGESGSGRTEWTMAAFAADVVAVIDDLALDEVVLVGHSMGGDVAVDAARMLGRRALGVIWIDTYSRLADVSPPEKITAFVAQLGGDFPTRTRQYVRGMFLADADPALVEWISNDMASAPPEIALDALHHSLSNGHAMPALLAGLPTPVVAVGTASSRLDVADLARHGVRAVSLPGVGHFPMLEAPQRFDALLAELVADLELPGAGA